MRFTNNINVDNGGWYGRVLLIKMYYSTNYLYFGIADARSSNHAFTTPNSYFSNYYWYYGTFSVNYLTGKYISYIYSPIVEFGLPEKLAWSYTRSVTARNHYETDTHGLHKDTAYLMVGGDKYYGSWHGYIKNVKFFYG